MPDLARLAWPFDPTVYIGLAAFAVAYHWLARDRSRLQSAFFGLGVLVAWFALETPVDTIGDCCLQSVHMVQHILLGLIAPPLWLLGLTPASAARLTRLLPGLRTITEPLPAQVIFAVLMLGWHLPVLYDATLASEPLHIVEHLTFMAGGTLFWWPVLIATSTTARWRLREAGKLVYLVVGTLPQDTVSLILIFSHQPYYEHYVRSARAIAGVDPLTDQTLAGIALMAAGKISFLVAGVKIFFDWMIRVRAEEAGPRLVGG